MVNMKLEENDLFSTITPLFLSEVSHSQFRGLPVNYSVIEKFYCRRPSLQIFRLVGRWHLSR